MTQSEQRPNCEPTTTVESEAPALQAFAAQHAKGSGPKERAISAYYAVRDGFRYDPYAAEVSVEGLKATHTLKLGSGWCVSKAVLLAAVCRAAGVPARLGFADVRNHLSTAALRESMGTDIFYWHGYTAIWLGGQWLKATPAFNVELCEKFGFLPLEFNGEDDSIYHPFDKAGQRHMEYVHHRGEFDDVPIEAMRATFASEYPNMSLDAQGPKGDFDAEVRAEVGLEQKG